MALAIENSEKISDIKASGFWSFFSKILAFAAVLSLLAWGTAYYWLNYQLKPQLKDLKNQENSLLVEENLRRIERFVVLQKQLMALKTVLASHVFNGNVFKNVEDLTHPRVYFSSFSFDGPTRTANLRGVAANLQAMAEQIRILESRQGQDVESFEAGGFDLSATGLVSFNLKVVFDPKIFN